MPNLQKFRKFEYLLDHLSRFYTKYREENTIKKHQQYFKGWKHAIGTETPKLFFTGSKMSR